MRPRLLALEMHARGMRLDWTGDRITSTGVLFMHPVVYGQLVRHDPTWIHTVPARSAMSLLAYRTVSG